jgi:hypothetical protein
VYEHHGAQAAADATGIPVRSIRWWASAERWPRRLAVADPSPEKVEARSQAARVGWHSRRRTMADQLGNVGAELLEAIRGELAQRKRLNLRDAGIVLGIMLDKAELLAAQTGGSDGPTMSHEERIARLRELAAEWRKRAEASQGVAEWDLLGVMDELVGALAAVQDARAAAQAAGRIERAISLNLVERSVGDGALALAELLEAEGTPYQPPPGGGPKGGRRQTMAA